MGDKIRDRILAAPHLLVRSCGISQFGQNNQTKLDKVDEG